MELQILRNVQVVLVHIYAIRFFMSRC